ncbi:MAG TPA: 16S rRNA (cytosine(1402)-N(4))-methyltransferase RsmH [Candidatus Saccharimonadales bacterium]|nr:16S rRNA (cytosine(1402)-N(4))-methyltransferase RsmH [Candidatus Saccharimonadales bacterium]
MPEFTHIPVLLNEVLAWLEPRDKGRYADGTLGGAGHAEAILKASSPTGKLYGCDQDGAALEAATARLSPYEGRYELRRGNFAELAGWIEHGSCNGVLLDLGVSSPQLDVGERGFSIQQDGPLDMRMDTRQGLTAAEVVNSWTESELTRVFREYGEEPQARRFARAIVEDRQRHRFERTGELASLIERLAPRHGKKRHPATQVFQALRMTVNNEMSSLRSGLAAALTILRPGGRLAVITFHSLEDRVVKEFGRAKARDYTFEGEVDVPELRRMKAPEARLPQRKAILPSDEEVKRNPRARSAQLRILEKV